MARTYVIHYSEVALKGNNRPEFVRTLRRCISRSLPPLAETRITSRDGRLILETDAPPSEVEGGLSKVFGIAWFAETSVVEPVYGQILGAVLAAARSGKGGTFMIDVRRADKSFPLTSMEMERRLGEAVATETGRKVDLSHPDESVHVDVIRGRVLVHSDKVKGLGGLPVGTGGRVMHLFSGGIDSPVAAWLLMKRGCNPVYLHFYLAPTPEYALHSKIVGLVKVLSGYSGRSTLILVPFADYQLATAGVPSDLEPSLFRRFMRMTAEALAPRFGASAISTGDSLAQAASQTVWNLGVFDMGSRLPVLRPLLTYDKEEVVRLAKQIGTYELSIEEYKDCCAIITRHPRTRAKEEMVSRYAEKLRLQELAERTADSGTLVTYTPSSAELKSTPMSEVKSRASRLAAPALSPTESKL